MAVVKETRTWYGEEYVAHVCDECGEDVVYPELGCRNCHPDEWLHGIDYYVETHPEASYLLHHVGKQPAHVGGRFAISSIG